MNVLHRAKTIISTPSLFTISKHFKSFIIKDNDDFVTRVMNSNVPVIVNFHAEWCEPCQLLTPQLKGLVDESEAVDLAIVDVEKNPELVHAFEVKAVPAVLAIRNGLVVDKFVGLVDSDLITKLVDKMSGKSNSDVT
nr:PREDICTED: thioredoxin, mitochondrial [Bemisia tabaci]